MVYAAERKLILLVAYKHKKLPYSKRELENHFRRLHKGPLNAIPASKVTSDAISAPLEAARKAKNAASEEIKTKLNAASTLSLDELGKASDGVFVVY